MNYSEERLYKKRLYQRQWREKNLEKYKSYNSYIYSKDYSKQARIEKRNFILKSMGNKCIKCGFTDVRALQIDHINGGGTKEKQEIGEGVPFYNYLIELIKLNIWQKGYQILCANCNSIKKYDNREVPNGTFSKIS